MLGLDVIGSDPTLGVSWGDVGDVGKAAFPYVHATGKGIASAFGAGAAAEALESVEQKQGWLPATPTPANASVTKTVETTAKAVAPKYAAAPQPKAQPKAQPSVTPTADARPAASSSNHTALIVGGIGVLGVIAFLFLRGAH